MCAAAVILVSNGSFCAGCKVEQGGRKKGKVRKEKEKEKMKSTVQYKLKGREETERRQLYFIPFLRSGKAFE